MAERLCSRLQTGVGGFDSLSRLMFNSKISKKQKGGIKGKPSTIFPPKKEKIVLGKPHPVTQFVSNFRNTLLNLSFDEIINPSIVNEEDVYKQYGPEAPLILDRSFYLAGLSRIELGISKKITTQIKKIADIDISKLRQIFRELKEAKTEADDLVEELVKQLKIKTEHAIQILALFPEMKKLEPIPTKLILRSHMTAAWYLTVSSLAQKSDDTLKLFSIGPRFRREQRLDAFHLYESLSASVVMAGKKINLKQGKELTKKILTDFGFEKVKFQTKTATSNYYTQGTEFEIFVKLNGKDVEIGDGGLYSSTSCENYNIPYPVFNVGFGVERIVMIMENIKDIRTLVYPQFYGQTFFSDQDIAEGISFKQQPKTLQGKTFAKKIASAILKHKDDLGIKEILVYKGQGFKIFISEPEEGKKLLGPAGLNVVYVYGGNILGVNEKDQKFAEVIKKGVRVCSYIEAFSNLFASFAEKKVFGKHTLKMADTLPSINLTLKKEQERFIVSQQKKIDVRGPIFLDCEITK